MNNPIAFQYTVLQYGHDLVTGEWLNVGVVVYSKDTRFFQAKLLAKYQRITQAFPGADGEFYRRFILHLQASLNQLSLAIAKNELSFFPELPDQIEALLSRVLTPDDVSVRFGEARGGLAEDLESTIEEMYIRLVEYYVEKPERGSRTDDEIASSFRRVLKDANLLAKLPPTTIRTPLEDREFPHAWKNGAWNLIQPLSFDLVQPDSISRKTKEWIGLAAVLKNSTDVTKLYLVVGRPHNAGSDVQRAYRKAKSTMEGEAAHLPLEIVEEDKSDSFVQRIRPLVEHPHH